MISKEMSISKELLSEVFAREVSEINGGCTDKEIVVIAYFDGFRQAFNINIYELAHKCKEWAFFNDFNIVIKMRIPDIYRGEKKIDYGVFVNDELLSWWFSTETEAIFLACNYILKELSNS